MASAQVLPQVAMSRARIRPFEYVFRALTILGAIEVSVFVITFAANPTAPGDAGQGPLYRAFFGLIWGPLMLTIGALLIWRARGNVVGRFAILFGMAVIGGQFAFDLGSQESSAIAFELLILFAVGLVVPSFGYLMFAFPDGNIYPPRLRPWLWAFAIVKFAGVGLEIMGSQSRIKIFALRANPVFVPALATFEPLIVATIGIAGVMTPMLLLPGFVSLVLRYQAAQPNAREQIKWMVWALGVFMVALLAMFAFIFSVDRGLSVFDFAIPALIISLAQGFFVVALSVAILKHHLFDIDIVINRALVYAAMTCIVAAIYFVCVVLLGAVFEASGNFIVPLIATGIVALLFQPLRDRLQRATNHLLYGQRDEPYTVLSQLGKRLEGTLAPDAALNTVVETVAQSLKLPYAALYVFTGATRELRAEYGARPKSDAPMRACSLVYQGEQLGELMVAPRNAHEPLSDKELRLLEDIAHQAGVAAYAAKLTSDVQRSREQIVTGREEERRRLRRDLHDGLGTTLTGIRIKIGAVLSNMPAESPDAEVLNAVRAQTLSGIAEVRRIAYDLRPPALDELGLLAALREQAALFGCRLDAPEQLPALSAAVEVVAYRIALEAMNNAVQHANARACGVRLQLDEGGRELIVQVSDDGVGMSPGARSGVGLNSMRERAEELNGALTIDSVTGNGTRVTARLPLR